MKLAVMGKSCCIIGALMDLIRAVPCRFISFLLTLAAKAIMDS